MSAALMEELHELRSERAQAKQRLRLLRADVCTHFRIARKALKLHRETRRPETLEAYQWLKREALAMKSAWDTMTK